MASCYLKCTYFKEEWLFFSLGDYRNRDGVGSAELSRVLKGNLRES